MTDNVSFIHVDVRSFRCAHCPWRPTADTDAGCEAQTREHIAMHQPMLVKLAVVEKERDDLKRQNHGMQINQRLRDAGVVWHDCSGCGRNWPFPTGQAVDREWLCTVCSNAELGRIKRTHDSLATH